MKKLLVVLAFLPNLAFAEDTPDWWVGIWAYDLQWCVAKDQIGSVTPAPIAITDEQVIGYENSCAVTEARALGEMSVFLTAECESEGETMQEEYVIMRGENAIWIWFGYDQPTKFWACD